MYVCIRICAYAFFVCIRACGPLKRLYWVIYCAAIAIMFCVSEQTLIYTWLYHMFSNISYCFSFLLLILSLLLFVLLLLFHVQHFQFWFHWLSLIAVDRVSCGKFTMILLVRWFHSLRHWLLLLLLLRIFVACCLLLLNLCVSFLIY